MCGIVGLIAKTETGDSWKKFIPAAQQSLSKRGPDATSQFDEEKIILGHCRLSIIDLSETANQPMFDEELVIIYNGEIFNFKELRKNLEEHDGIHFQTMSDTEVILKLYRKHGIDMLKNLNGFFALAIYDRQKKQCLIARDRFGEKPLFYYEDDDRLVFASEMKALMEFPIKRELETESLYEYLQLNYIAAPNTIFKNILKLLPGDYLFYDGKQLSRKTWYNLQTEVESQIQIKSYEEAKEKLFELLNDAVRLRLISDVPLGAFLSGGIDSSIICGLASRHTQHLKTFSIGYDEHDFFDETNYAKLVAKHFSTEHTIFSLKRNDLNECLFDVLNYFDEPFGDSSALPVYYLSKQTRKHVKVALSGDGADELFGGYLKHIGELRARNPQLPEKITAALSPLWRLIPKSRNNKWGNRIRQFDRFAAGMKMTNEDRYWRWCSIADTMQADQLMLAKHDEREFSVRKQLLISSLPCSGGRMNGVMLNDVQLVLPNDMLMKVDSMSMSNSLEVRSPFLDYRIVEFAFLVEEDFKVDRRHRKKIVHDAFRDFLPSELYNRPKRGFEIPLLSFLNQELQSRVEDCTSVSFLQDQKIFNAEAVQRLKRQLISTNPQDTAARMWGLLVFQHWWKHWMI